MKNKLILALVVLMVAVSVLAVSAQDVSTVDNAVSESVSDDVVSESVSDDDALSIDNSDDSVYQDGEGSGDVKDVWIDQTVDNSMVYINGELRVIDSSNALLLVLPLSNSTRATFSTVDSIAKDLEIQTIDNAIEYVKKLLNAKDVKIFSGASSNITKVYDHRKYETIEDNDAQLIGDADYLNGAYGLSSTRTHVASGDYGRIVNITLDYILKATVDETGDDPAVPVENNTAAENATNTTNTDIKNTTDNPTDTVNSNDNVTNNTHIKPKDVAKATGIPFAVLIVALLGIGISIRRRK